MKKEEKSKSFFLELKTLLSQDNVKKIVIVMGVVGIILIFSSSLFKAKPVNKTDNLSSQNDTQEYAKLLEENLKNIVSEISGVGEAKVLVTLESSKQTVYATEQKKSKEATEDKTSNETSKKKESDDIETRYIKVKNADGTEQALSVTQIQPSIKGVVVICKGGDNPEIKEKVKNAVKTALNITSKRVFVTR